MTRAIHVIHAGLVNGRVIPYLGPGVLNLGPVPPLVPASAATLVGSLTARASVPFRIRNNLGAAAQYIENFKHRKTVASAMREAFSRPMPPTALHLLLAGLPSLPLWVHAWYDDLPQQALAATGRAWGMVQGVSHAEHAGDWTHHFDADGSRRVDPQAPDTGQRWPTLLYQPLGSVAPAANFLVSDSDYVEVLTEIDIQTPIPGLVQQRRSGRSFLFLGCRFSSQLERIFAQQIIKRSSDRHWAVLPEEPTRNEVQFMARHGIERIAVPLADCVAEWIELEADAARLRLAAN